MDIVSKNTQLYIPLNVIYKHNILYTKVLKDNKMVVLIFFSDVH